MKFLMENENNIFKKRYRKSSGITDFLKYRWSDKELKSFKNDLKKFKQSLKDKIITYPTTESDDKLRFAFLGKKQVKIYFDVQGDYVEILLFMPSKGNPDNLQKILNIK